MGKLRQKTGALGCRPQPLNAPSRSAVLTALLLLLGIIPGSAQADAWRNADNGVHKVNKYLSGKVIDHTANHGKDRRMWSRNLWQKRDLYVYLPPNYCPDRKYPLMIWFHGFYQDEKSFLRLVPIIDEAIRKGKLPPIVVAAPDGSHHGVPQLKHPGTFFLNSQAGNFADFVLTDMWDFVVHQYSICSDRRAHVVAGYGMGGFAAYNYAIRNRDAFGVVIGISPPLNLRWVDKYGNRAANFNPKNWEWDVEANPGDVIARGITGGRIVHLGDWIAPIFGYGVPAVAKIAAENPIEMIDKYRVCPGQLEMYVAYSGRDEYNIDAQVDSFLYLCKWRGLAVGVGYDPYGRHNMITAKKLLPGALQWLSCRIAPLAPPRVMEAPPPAHRNLAANHYGTNLCKERCTPSNPCDICRYKQSVPDDPVKYFLRKRLKHGAVVGRHNRNPCKNVCTPQNPCAECRADAGCCDDPVGFFLRRRKKGRSPLQLPETASSQNCETGACNGNCPKASFCPDCVHKRLIPGGPIGNFIRKHTKYRSNFQVDSNLNYGSACGYCGQLGCDGTCAGGSWDCPNCSRANSCPSCCQKKRRLGSLRKNRRHPPTCLPPAAQSSGAGCVCIPPPGGIDRLPD